ncbi:protein-export chaperone SecB [Clostridium sp. UBA1652]|uniref:protein-export chaperone SecB n=1 Tax=Clostridium sp. UBA1652 TaxID=1946348 RepID=UPI00257EE5CF|nr:protein-export chaperone SecB [Clostridium sp. UBA1652]
MIGQDNSCKLILHKVYAENIDFRRTDKYREDKKNLEFKLGYAISNVDENNKCKLTIKVDLEDDNNRSMFFSLDFSGIFSLDNGENLINTSFKKNALAILFPYVRSMVTTITAQCGIQSIILPPMNFNALIDNEEKLGSKNEFIEKK